MKSAIIPVAQGFQDEEFIYPYYRLLEEDFEVHVATPTGTDVLGKYGVPARATVSTKDALDLQPSLLFLPGGFESPDRLRLDEPTIEMTRRCMERQVTIAAICHGPWVLITADVVTGRTCAGYKSIHVDLRNAGAIVSAEPVVVDGNLVTGDHYRNNGAFMAATLRVHASRA